MSTARAWLMAAVLVLSACTGDGAATNAADAAGSDGTKVQDTAGTVGAEAADDPRSNNGTADGSDDADGTSTAGAEAADDAAAAVSNSTTAAVTGAGDDRLLLGLSAQVTPEGLVLSWTVDESRAERITGFSCVYRTPGHIRLGVAGAVACGADRSPADARSRTVTALPEYGGYDFEVVAESGPGEAIPWPQRALRLHVDVTPEQAGPAGPDHTVTGAGPVVEGCGPDGGPGDASAGRPWRLDEIASAAHLTHYPGHGWTPGGDPDAAPEWPEPPSLAELFDDAELDGQLVGQVLSGDADPADAAGLLSDERALVPLRRASAGTKALVRPDASGGWQLRLHTSYPFGADYVYEPDHAVPGWGGTHPAAGAQLWNRTDCPPPHQPDATHDVALAVSHDAGAGRMLEHSGYGWWAVAPVGMFPERIVATKGPLSWGEPAPSAPAAPAQWHGRLSGHLFVNQQRYAMAGDVALVLDRSASGELSLSARIDNVALAPIDHRSLQPYPGTVHSLPALTLHAASHAGGAWTGPVGLGAPADGELAEMPAPGDWHGDWRARAYGPDASEIAGRLRLWTPLGENADPSADWPGQAVLVAGFGAAAP